MVRIDHRENIKPNPKTPWWLWPNLLSLDAPLVALLWHVAFAQAFGLTVDRVTAILLGLAVWLVYVVDRLLDVRAMQDTSRPTARHGFYARHQRASWATVLIAMIASASITALFASKTLLVFGAVMALIAGAYLLWVHQRWRWLRKEMACGMIFSAGTSLSLLVPGEQTMPQPWFWATALWFGALCGANCLTIANVEECADARHDPMAMTQQSPQWQSRLPWTLPLGCILSILLWSLSGQWLFATMGIGWFGLWVVNKGRAEQGNWRRVAADGCLLAPLLWLMLA
mgnify:CR=1 FL=1|jgi:hypothetical protein